MQPIARGVQSEEAPVAVIDSVTKQARYVTRAQAFGMTPANDVTMSHPMDPLAQLEADHSAGRLPNEADYQARKKLLLTRAADSASAALTDDGLQFAADTYRKTGKFPGAFGRSPQLQARVLNKIAADAAASGDSAGSIAARAAALKANGMALDANTKLMTATNGYAATLEKNLTNLEQAYGQTDASGSPLINRAIRAWQQGGSGDPQTASMVAWLNAVQGEYAKMRSGNLGNTPASDASMRDAKEVINKYMSDGGIQAVAQAIRAEAANRRAALTEENSRLSGELGIQPPGASSSVPAAGISGGLGGAPSMQGAPAAAPMGALGSPQRLPPSNVPGAGPQAVTTSAPPQAPVRVQSVEQAKALQPGTLFMTPDGRIKVR